MRLWKGPRLGSRTLKLKDRGSDVKELHELLRSQGYDMGGEEDYGYLTKDAVRQFQREHGLPADGIAGPRFFALFLADDLPIRRRIHVVQPGETLEEIAAQYKVRPEALGRGRVPSQIYPGQRLLFFDREIWAIATKSLPEDFNSVQLTGLVLPFDSENGKHLPHVVQPIVDGNGQEKLHSLLHTKRAVKASVQKLAELPQGARGLYLPWREVGTVDGARYVTLLKRLRQKLPPGVMLWVHLGPGVPSWRLWGGVDYEAVGRLADRVVLSLPPPTEPGPIICKEELEKALTELRRCVPLWKTLVVLPVYALQWEWDGEEQKCSKLPYATARSRAFRHGARLGQTEDKVPFYHYQSRGRQFQIWLPQYGVLGEVLAMINRRNLAGVILDRLGMEDPRLWDVLVSYFRPARL